MDRRRCGPGGPPTARPASETGSDGGAWLDGKAAEAAACDASMTPVVTGDLDLGVLDELVRLCVRLDRLRRDGTPDPPEPPIRGPSLREVLEQQVIGSAVALLSGPGGLAGFLRRRAARHPPGRPQPAAGRGRQHRYPGRDPAGGDRTGPALPVPQRLRPARLRLRSPPPDPQGRRRQDLRPDCILFCTFHHQVVIHRWGWTVVLNPDGTTTAWNKDGTKILHSHSRNHSPPPRPGRTTPGLARCPGR